MVIFDKALCSLKWINETSASVLQRSGYNESDWFEKYDYRLNNDVTAIHSNPNKPELDHLRKENKVCSLMGVRLQMSSNLMWTYTLQRVL